MTDASADTAAGVIVTFLATAVVAAYLLGFAGLALMPELVAGLALGASAAWAVQEARARGRLTRDAPERDASFAAWALIVIATVAALAAPVWPELLPPGGGSDLVHHLTLVDAIERTGHLVDSAAAGPALGEMAHYTPGLHLLIVVTGSLAGVDAFRAAYPLLLATIALKAGILFLIAHRVLAGAAGRMPLALAAVPLVLFAPRAYSVDGFLQHGFMAQVAAELFVVAGWWALTRWRSTRCVAWVALAGLCGASVFLVWPIWIGPLLLAAAMAMMVAPRMDTPTRVSCTVIAVAPMAMVAALHLSRHAAWVRMAGASGAVPAFVPGPPGWALIALAAVGVAVGVRIASARVTLFFFGGVVLQAVALYGLARLRGAETPYMAMKMIYLGVYPVAVLATVAIARVVAGVPARLAAPAAWASAALVAVIATRIAEGITVPSPVVSPDLYHAGRWARASIEPACVDYVVESAEQAYWLHLAVMGQSRSSPRTADIDGYTTNRAAGRWIEGTSLPYAVATYHLLPGEVLRDAEVVRSFGSAVVIRRPGGGC